MTVACDYCGAQVGQPCYRIEGPYTPAARPHEVRWRMARHAARVAALPAPDAGQGARGPEART